MEKVAISKFKATCLGLLDRVNKTGEPILVTKRGRPIAQILPAPPPQLAKESAFGCMQGTSEQLGDIVGPLSAEDWEVLR